MKKQTNILEYFILSMLLAQSSFPFFIGNNVLIIFFVITLAAFILKIHHINKFIIKFMAVFIVLMIAQIITTGNFIIGPFIGILLRIFYAFIAIKLIGPDFHRFYVNLMLILTIISLFFWLLLSFVPGMYDTYFSFSKNYIVPITIYPELTRYNIIIYTNEYWLLNDVPRNAGPFWEPGGFGVYLNLALLFNTMITGKIVNIKNILFFIALITTFSLGSYAAFFVFVFAYLFFVKRIYNYKTILSFLILLYVGYYSYNNYDFLGGKFEERYQNMQKFNPNLTYKDIYYPVGRNEQAILDINSFLKHPLFGEGQFVEYDFGASASGLTLILRLWGIFGFTLMFTVMYFSFKKFVKLFSLSEQYILVSMLTILTVAISQTLFGKPFFLGLIFAYLIFDDPKNLLKLRNIKFTATIKPGVR